MSLLKILKIFFRLKKFSSLSIFTVVAPYTIRQGKTFNVQLRGFDVKATIRFVIRLNGTTDGGETFKLKKKATLSRGNSKASVSFDVSFNQNCNFRTLNNLFFLIRPPISKAAATSFMLKVMMVLQKREL